MLYIVGLSHFAQTRMHNREKTEGQKTFTNLLERTIGAVHPRFVAEEDCVEALVNRNGISIAKEVADATGIEHRFCDPDQAQRQSMGYASGGDIFRFFTTTGDNPLSDDEARLKAYAIEMGRYFPVRERFWLDGLNGCRDHCAVFICGYGHLINSFLGLVESDGIPYKIVEADIGVAVDEREFVQMTAKYLSEHPELKNWTHKNFPLPRLVTVIE
jgi:hypothetical protein